MDLVERVNTEVAKKLNKLTMKQFEELMNVSKTKRHNNYNIKTEYNKLKSYTRNVLKGNNNYIVNYQYVKGKDDFGRLQSKNPSLQRLFNGFRGILSNGITRDLDMSNCHPNILLNLCKEHNIKCDYVKQYIYNREEGLKELMTEYEISRDEAKQTYLKCLNKEELTTMINNKKVKNINFLNYDKETTNIIQSLYEIYKKDYDKYVDEDYNRKGKMVNLILCKYEDIYLREAIDYLKKQKIEICTNMFDGCMIYKTDKYDIKQIIEELNKIFKDRNITWTEKQHNIDLLETLNNMEIVTTDYFDGQDIIEVTMHILEGILDEKIYKCGDEIYYITDDKIISNEKQIDSELRDLISDQKYTIVKIKIGKSGEEIITYVDVSKELRYINDLITMIKSKAPRDNKFIENIWNETLFKLYFKNGYYDFQKKEFFKGKYNRTFIKIERDYTPKINKKARKSIYDKILNPVFSIESDKEELQIKLMKYYLYRLSRVIAGNIGDKKYILLQGLRDCGKGVLSDLIMNCFERYVKITNAENFEYKNNNTDPAKQNSWIMDYQFVRLAITQEITVDVEKNKKMNGNAIKKFCSGGDSIEGRKNHQDEKTFKIQASLMICCNDIPEVEPKDCLEKCDEFQMKSKFISKDFKESDKLATFKYYERDLNIKETLLKDSDIIDEFTRIIIEAYNEEQEYPKEIKDELEEMDDEDDYNKLFNIFTITNDKRDFLSNDNLRIIISQNKRPFIMKKCKMLLKTKGINEDRTSGIRGISGLVVKGEETARDRDEELEKQKKREQEQKKRIV